MQIEYLDAPDGIEATWYEADDTLFIALATDLDELTRRRYISEAKRWYGTQHRRHAIPFILPAGGLRRAVSQNKTATAGLGVVVAAAAATAAVMVPMSLDHDNSNTVQRPPGQAAPAPSRSAPAGTPGAPTNPPRSGTPRSDPRPSQSTPLPGKALPGGLQGVAGVKVRPPKPPVHLPVTVPTEIPPPVTTAPTPARRLLDHICLRVDLGADVQIGCGRLLSRGQLRSPGSVVDGPG